MNYKSWTKIDNGREGLWNLDTWLTVIQIATAHEGDSFRDKSSPFNQALATNIPKEGVWGKVEEDGQFRSTFRDYSKPWTATRTIEFTEEGRVRPTPLGKQLALGEKGPAEAFRHLLLTWEEDGESPFQVLAAAVLEAGSGLSTRDFYFGIMKGWRPGDDLQNALRTSRADTISQPESNPLRRLKLLLSILEYAGCIREVGGNWLPWDTELLKQVAASFPTSAPQTTSASLEGMVRQFSADSASAGLTIAPKLALRFLSSLLAKRFLILTGLSGSGKTKLAHAFAAWIALSSDQYRLVAVGADWTTSENLLGYQDALRPDIYRKPSNGALDLILEAGKNPDQPYVLILDEMNLSHVERYFADILSSIESGQAIALHGSPEKLKLGESGPPELGPTVALPDNLFIIGTVNIDETTYMFSPKVLDRANVIEFRATSDQIGSFLQDPRGIQMGRIASQGAGYGSTFVQTARGAVNFAPGPSETEGEAGWSHELRERLVEVFSELAPIGAEFGFRSALEISRFVRFHALLSGQGWSFNEAFDAQVLQKLLPKLHGSERRLRPVLERLDAICDKHECTLSKEKISRMLDRLRDGFTSFAEA